jgi:hypothetical protein
MDAIAQAVSKLEFLYCLKANHTLDGYLKKYYGINCEQYIKLPVDIDLQIFMLEYFINLPKELISNHTKCIKNI